MKGTKYLSDVLDVSLFEKGYMNVVYAPCGSGKTTCAIKSIAPLASSPLKAIYLIDTRIGKERLSHEDGLRAPSVFYEDIIASGNTEFVEPEEKSAVVVATYAQFGIWCSRNPGFEEKYEYIICDEPHNLVLFSKIKNKEVCDVPAHRIAKAAIESAVNGGKVMVVAISATPGPLKEMRCELKDIPIDRTDLRRYEEKNTIFYARIEDVLNSIPLGQRGGLYVKHVGPMKEFAETLRKRGFNPLMIWSDQNEEHPLTKEQVDARQHIIDNEAVPDEYDMFLFNATAETAINIRSHMDFFIAHNTGDTHITQSRGRYRGDLDTLYVWDKKSPYVVVVPDEFLDRFLTYEDLDKLREQLPLVSVGHHKTVSHKQMLRVITGCGYACEEGTNFYKEGKLVRKKWFILRKEEQKSGENPI